MKKVILVLVILNVSFFLIESQVSPFYIDNDGTVWLKINNVDQDLAGYLMGLNASISELENRLAILESNHAMEIEAIATQLAEQSEGISNLQSAVSNLNLGSNVRVISVLDDYRPASSISIPPGGSANGANFRQLTPSFTLELHPKEKIVFLINFSAKIKFQGNNGILFKLESDSFEPVYWSTRTRILSPSGPSNDYLYEDTVTGAHSIAISDDHHISGNVVFTLWGHSLKNVAEFTTTDSISVYAILVRE